MASQTEFVGVVDEFRIYVGEGKVVTRGENHALIYCTPGQNPYLCVVTLGLPKLVKFMRGEEVLSERTGIYFMPWRNEKMMEPKNLEEVKEKDKPLYIQIGEEKFFILIVEMD